MLQALREKSSGWIATIILGLLMIPFAFFGMEQYLFQRTETFAARIQAPPAWWPSAPDWWVVRKAVWHEEEITVEEFRSEFERQRQQQRQFAGEEFDARAFESEDNKRNIIDRMIDQRIMRMAVDRGGLAIGNAQLTKAIQSFPEFQVDGRFDQQRYRLMLASGQPARTPVQFQEEIRETLKQQLLAARLAGSAFVTNSEGQRLISLLSEKRDVTYAVLPSPPVDSAPVPANEIVAWYKAHPQDFRAPETVTIEYVEVNAATLPEPPPADEAALRERYDQEKGRFVEPEQRLTSHILIKVAADADAATQKAAEAKAQDLLKQVRAGGDFAALARQHSEDASKDAGGDLGWVAQNGQMVEPFEDAVFATAGGQVAGPVKTEFGWHLIQVREIKPGSTIPFEQARPELERLVAETARERAYNDITGTLVDEVLKAPGSLGPAARSVKLSVQRIGPFARGQGSGIAASPAVQRVAFSEDLIQSRNASDPVDIAPNHSVVIRVVEHTPEQVQPLEKVGAQVVAAIRADRARKAVEAEAEAVLARLKKGESLNAIATEKGWVVTSVPGVPRNAPVPDARASEAYFQVPAPAAGKVAPGRSATADGRLVLFEVTGVGKADENEVTAEMRAGFLRDLGPRIGEQDAVSVGKALRKGMKVDIAMDRL
jgi:peptidyl-prolyl cis-trans isomerase D